MKQALAISGTPGVGKTATGTLLAERLDFKIIELSRLVERENLYSHLDEERRTLVADMDAVGQYLERLLLNAEQTYLVIGHFADVVPDEFLKCLVILRCHPQILSARLRKRQWTRAKILENVQAEILGECTSQALCTHPIEKIAEIDASKQTKEEVVNCIEKILSGQTKEFRPGRISWLQTLDAQDLHRIMELGQLP
jgi:adenylate kinase